MYLLGIESSCDETAASVSRDGREILSDAVLSQAKMHAEYGGVVPEIASRRHVEGICRVVKQALDDAKLTARELDAVAVTYAPGLIGALLVGVNFAKGLAFATDKPLVPVHHIRGHIAANYIAFPDLKPPFCALVASGGHSLLVDVRDYTDMRVMGSTRDDAAGEAFDKAARVMGLPYPGGRPMDELARSGNDRAYRLPHAEVRDAPLDFSFSGLKTSVINIAHTCRQQGKELDKPGLAASFCRAVSEALVPRALQAAKVCGYGKLAAAGGVVANSRLRRDLTDACRSEGIKLYVPPVSLCGDNGSMIACQGYYEYMAGARASEDLNAYPTMSPDEPGRY